MNKKVMELLNKWHLEWRRCLQNSRDAKLSKAERTEQKIRAEVLMSCSRRLKKAMKNSADLG